MRFEFSKMQMKDIEGKDVTSPELWKTVANVLWHSAKNLDLVEISMAINRGEAVELREADVKELEQLIKDPKNGVFAFARKQILDFIKAMRDLEKQAKEKD